MWIDPGMIHRPVVVMVALRPVEFFQQALQLATMAITLKPGAGISICYLIPMELIGNTSIEVAYATTISLELIRIIFIEVAYAT